VALVNFRLLDQPDYQGRQSGVVEIVHLVDCEVFVDVVEDRSDRD